jgi:hypothetical protein
MDSVNVVVRTADRARKAEVSMSRANTGADIIQAAITNWKLPTDIDYALVNTSTNTSIQPGQALTASVVGDGHVLELQPVLVAG